MDFEVPEVALAATTDEISFVGGTAVPALGLGYLIFGHRLQVKLAQHICLYSDQDRFSLFLFLLKSF